MSEPDPGPIEGINPELTELARHLRQSVGAEMRAEAEITEAETQQGRRRRLALGDIARQAAHRGDRVTALTSQRTMTGRLVHVGRDYLSLETTAEWVDVMLAAAVLTIAPNPSGGVRPAGGSATFAARLAEYEQTGERIEVVAARLSTTIRGTIEVAATDHVVILDEEGDRVVVPTGLIELVLRDRPG